MKIIISPAKKMNVDTDSYEVRGLPEFIDDTRILMEKIRTLSFQERSEERRCRERV